MFFSCQKNLQEKKSTTNCIWTNENKYLISSCDSLMKNVEVDLISTDTLLYKRRYTFYIEGINGNKLYFHDDKLRGLNYPIFISKDTVMCLYPMDSSSAGNEYWNSFTSNFEQQYMYFSSYYLTGDINSQYEDEDGRIVIPESILRFGCTYMLNMQNGELKYFMYYEDGYWNNCDQWVTSPGDQELAFDAELDDLE